ncbi:MAG: helix-turn-helix domain-containing protein [Prevotella sp.]
MSTINERFREIRNKKGLSQEDFARGMHRSRSEIKNIEYGKTEPKEEIIQSVCSAYNVNETWIRTGDSDMFNPVNRDEEISAFIGDIMSDESDNFRRRLISVLSRLDASEWSLLEKMAMRLAEAEKKEE